MRPRRHLAWIARLGVALTLLGALTACGGGGGSGGGGGGGTVSSGGGSTPPGQVSGAAPIALAVQQLAASPYATANIPYVTVTVCNGGQCVDIPNVLVDTGSSGLRVFASDVASLGLPSTTTGGSVVGECVYFASGYLWGAMRSATVKLGDQTTTQPIPIQVINDSALPAGGASTYCTSGTTDLSANGSLLANGVLGISNFINDGSAGSYFNCSAGSCTSTSASASSQASNPVAALPAGYNNGVLISWPQVADSGAGSAQGTLVLGIGSAPNNQLPSGAQTYALDYRGDLGVSVNGVPGSGFLDTGSNAYFLDLSGVPLCRHNNVGFYCPSTPVALTMQLSSGLSNSGNLSITIGNADTQFQSGNLALPQLGGPAAVSGLVDLGLPFNYGRSIAVGIENPSNPTAPYGYDAF